MSHLNANVCCKNGWLLAVETQLKKWRLRRDDHDANKENFLYELRTKPEADRSCHAKNARTEQRSGGRFRGRCAAAIQILFDRIEDINLPATVVQNTEVCVAWHGWLGRRR
jgi:hypothetical protein